MIATATLPRIVGGVPLHLRSLSVAVNKANFLFNPSYCGPLSTDSTVGAIQGAERRTPSSPFAVTDCTSLGFKPDFKAASPSKPSRANGASLRRHARAARPRGEHPLGRRVAAEGAALAPDDAAESLHRRRRGQAATRYKSCPAGSKVGSATVTTPVLPEKLTGPAYLVSHGGAAFPDLDLILEGDHGVQGDPRRQHRHQKRRHDLDVRVGSRRAGLEVRTDLPTGPNSALGSVGSLCAQPLDMPTTITAQSGKVIKQKARLSIGSCKIKDQQEDPSSHKLVLSVKVFTAGRVSVKSGGLHTTYKKVGGPKTFTIKVPLSKKANGRSRPGAGCGSRCRVGFNPKHKDEYHSAAFAKVTFKH